MNWFLRLTLAHKLLLSFMLCSMLPAGVGVFGTLHAAELGPLVDQAYAALPSSSEDQSATAEEVSGQAEQLQNTMAFLRLAEAPGPALRKPAAFMSEQDPDESHFARF
jgi:methyl-accepting chemotaxis protein